MSNRDLVLRAYGKYSSDGPEIEVRSIRPGDEDAIRRFYLFLDKETLHSYYGATIDPQVLVREEKLTQECNPAQGRDVRLIAVNEGEIVGIGMLLKTDEPEEQYEVGHLIGSGHQGQGIGSLLMGMLLAHAMITNKKDIIAQVQRQNFAARALMRKFGFSLTNKDKDEMIWKRSR